MHPFAGGGNSRLPVPCAGYTATRIDLRLPAGLVGCEAAIAVLADRDAPRRHGAEFTLFDWRDRLRCSSCRGRDIDFVVAGAKEGGISC